MNLKECLSTKGFKHNLQFDTKTKIRFENDAGFTDDELAIFKLRARGFSIEAISQKMSENDKYYSKSTIEKNIRSIKKKIVNIL